MGSIFHFPFDVVISPLLLLILIPIFMLPVLWVTSFFHLRVFAFSGILVQFIFTLFLAPSVLNQSEGDYHSYFTLPLVQRQFFNISYEGAVDGISYFFIVLVPFLILLCIGSLINKTHSNYRERELFILLYLMDFILLNVFATLDFFLFFFFLEASVPPMFLLIGIWGARTRRVASAYIYYFFSMVASLTMAVAILYIYWNAGSASIFILYEHRFFGFDIFSIEAELVLWFAIFFSLAVKMPVFPFHIWLPEAHGEASTVGSVILAGLYLKMAGYGLLRFLVPTFPSASDFFKPLVYTISLAGVYYCSMTLLRQIDLKKFIAYSSVVHMNLSTIGLFSFSPMAIAGSLFSMIAHSFIASLLFFSVGILYDRFHTRIIAYYSDLVERLPLFSIIFFCGLGANSSFPLTVGFIAEALMLFGIAEDNFIIALIAAFGVGVTAIAHFFLINKLVYSDKKFSINYQYNSSVNIDITWIELLYVVPLLFAIIGFVFCSDLIVNIIEPSIQHLVMIRDGRIK